ncbi:uncharacterized protein LOC117102681 [Anneissia japonica]|uniref:uncharacterized protein LOC117102681 n=1 Tax=Anneissia japonica TaxID=1529436 RepID=UPI001425B18C|nr:uncharacterized protein LOC117102681 [Anneissia japonica]
MAYTARDLHDAMRKQRWDEVWRIIRAKPELVNEKSGRMTSLYWLVSSDYAPESLVLEFLKIAAKEVVDDVNMFGDSNLHLLALYGRVDALRRALEISTTCVNYKNQAGNTPLHYLMSANHPFLVHRVVAKALLQVGANSHIKNKSGSTPVDDYKVNECQKYDFTNKEQQKEEILEIFQILIPREILTRGEEAVRVYNVELETGRVTVNHARLMINGKESVGKTSFVNTLLDKPFNPEEDITDAFTTTIVGIQDSQWKEIEHGRSKEFRFISAHKTCPLPEH